MNKLTLGVAVLGLAATGWAGETYRASTVAEFVESLDKAQSGDSIVLASGKTYDLTGVVFNEKYHLDVSGKGNLTIEGEDATSWRETDNNETSTYIISDGAHRIFQHNQNGLQVKNITFKGITSSISSPIAQTSGYAGRPLFENCVFKNITANSGCADYVRVRDCLYSGNRATANASCGTYVYATSCVFENNSSGNNAACIVIGSVEDCAFTNNWCESSNWSSGGVLANSDGTMKVTRCSFFNCRSGYDGGVICDNDSTAAHFEISDSTFVNCSAVVSGGAIYCGAKTRITNCTFDGCSASSGGGCCGGVLTDCVVRNCEATGWAGACRYSVLTNCTVSGCRAMTAGGFAQCTAVHCILSNNQNTAEYRTAFRACRLTECDISESGTIRASFLDRCILRDMRPSVGFDAIFLGDAVNVADGDIPLEVRNCLIRDSSADYFLRAYGGTGKIENCTFLNNDISVRMICMEKISEARPGAFLSNNLFSGNTLAHSDKDTIDLAQNCGANGDLTLRNNLVQAIAESTFGEVVLTVSDNVVGKNARLCGKDNPWGAPDFMIRPSSPARNHALTLDWMAGAKDLLGNNRILGDLADIGCCECGLMPIGTVLMVR